MAYCLFVLFHLHGCDDYIGCACNWWIYFFCCSEKDRRCAVFVLIMKWLGSFVYRKKNTGREKCEWNARSSGRIHVCDVRTDWPVEDVECPESNTSPQFTVSTTSSSSSVLWFFFCASCSFCLYSIELKSILNANIIIQCEHCCYSCFCCANTILLCTSAEHMFEQYLSHAISLSLASFWFD